MNLRSGFSHWVQRYVRRQFTNLRIAAGSHELLHSVAAQAAPAIVVLNHSSWWDPLTCIALARTLPDRDHCAPMRAEQLKRFGFFRWTGFFPVEPARPREFVRHVDRVFSSRRAMLWITPQGRFVDPRRKSPLGRGADLIRRRYPEANTLSLALEYVFWNERRPEICARVQPVNAADNLAVVMEENSRHLAELSASRDPGSFRELWPERPEGWWSLWTA